MAQPPSVNPQGAAAPKKKTSPWLYVLIGCGGLIVVVGIAMVALGIFAVNKAKEAGLDPELLEEQPALAAAKMFAAVNPDIEIVEVDEEGQRVTFREKATGKTATVTLDELKQGRIVFESEEGGRVTIGGEEGGLTVESEEGRMVLQAGAEVELPSWLKAYPGAEMQGTMSSRTADAESGSVGMTTQDSVDEAAAFFEKVFKDAGLKVATVRSQGAGGTGAMISGESADGKRSAVAMISRDDDQTSIALTFTTKK